MSCPLQMSLPCGSDVYQPTTTDILSTTRANGLTNDNLARLIAMQVRSVTFQERLTESVVEK